MRLTRLDIQRLRCLRDVSFRPAPGLNLVTGGNGAGKTSLVEAVHLLGYGRSFRGRVRDGLIRTGEPDLSLFAEWLDGRGRPRKAGLRHSGGGWEARLDGAPAPGPNDHITIKSGEARLVVTRGRIASIGGGTTSA